MKILNSTFVAYTTTFDHAMIWAVVDLLLQNGRSSTLAFYIQLAVPLHFTLLFLTILFMSWIATEGSIPMVMVLVFSVLGMSVLSTIILVAACILSARTTRIAPIPTKQPDTPDLAQAVERLRVVDAPRSTENVGDGSWAARPA